MEEQAVRSCRGCVLGPLLVVAVVELVLCVGFYQERWKALLALNRARAAAGEGLVIRSDGLGYYAWLRSLLLDGDWDFDNEFDGHNVLGDFVPPPQERTPSGRRPNPWSVGPALAWSPLIVPGHFLLCLLAGEADGYTLPYQLLVGLGTLLLALVGLGLLFGIARRFAAPLQAALATAFLTLGTPLVYYNALEGSMAHGPAAAMTAGLVWYWLRTYGSPRLGRWLGVGLLVGAAALLRWQLATLAVLPAGEALLTALRQRSVTARLLGLGAAAGGAVLAFLPQLLAWRWVYGAWLVTPMAVGHNWLAPALGEVLFGRDRGLLLWTPLVLVAGCGLLLGRTQRDREPLALLALAFAVQVYVLASLRGPGVYLGVAFGCRQLTEAVVLLLPGLALLMQQPAGRRSGLLGGLGCLLVLWNLLLLAQYRYGLVPADAGADWTVLLENVPTLVRRKRLELIGQVFLAPVALGLCIWLTTRPPRTYPELKRSLETRAA